MMYGCFFFCKQKTAYEVRIRYWSSDVCSSDLFRAARTGAVAPGAGGAAFRLEMLGIAKVDQRVEAGDRFEHHVAALAAVAAVGAAIFDIFFTPETDGAGAAVAGLHENLGLVEEMHRQIGRALCRESGCPYV